MPNLCHFLQVVARDADTGENGRITYTLDPDGDSPYFSLDPGSGQLRSTASLAPLAGTVTRLQVLARDNGQPQLSATGE